MGTYSTIRAFVRAQTKAEGPPSIEELAVELGISKSNARDRLQVCIDNNLIAKKRGRQRGYTLTPSGKRIA